MKGEAFISREQWLWVLDGEVGVVVVVVVVVVGARVLRVLDRGVEFAWCRLGILDGVIEVVGAGGGAVGLGRWLLEASGC
jgi:hypothetical protein